MNENKLILIQKILTQINDSPRPMGANMLSLLLNVPQASIGRILQYLDYNGYLAKVSNKGRVLTDEGRKYLLTVNTDLSLKQNADELITITESMDKSLLLDILKTRRILEQETARLAAANATDEDIHTLTEILKHQETEKQSNALGENEDLAFHKKIASMSKNRILEQLLTLILTQNNAYREFSFIRQHIASKSSNDHRAIIEALRTHDSEAASCHMDRHIAELIDDLSDWKD